MPLPVITISFAPAAQFADAATQTDATEAPPETAAPIHEGPPCRRSRRMAETDERIAMHQVRRSAKRSAEAHPATDASPAKMTHPAGGAAPESDMQAATPPSFPLRQPPVDAPLQSAARDALAADASVHASKARYPHPIMRIDKEQLDKHLLSWQMQECAMAASHSPDTPEGIEQGRLEIHYISQAIRRLKTSAGGRNPTLDLSALQLRCIPDKAIALLTHVKNINLSFNRLTGVPPSLAELPQLTDLNLSFNPELAIPISICFQPNLERLYLVGTPMGHALSTLGYPTALSVRQLRDALNVPGRGRESRSQ
jgi:hypothetical protein